MQDISHNVFVCLFVIFSQQTGYPITQPNRHPSIFFNHLSFSGLRGAGAKPSWGKRRLHPACSYRLKHSKIIETDIIINHSLSERRRPKAGKERMLPAPTQIEPLHHSNSHSTACDNCTGLQRDLKGTTAFKNNPPKMKTFCWTYSIWVVFRKCFGFSPPG